MRRYVVWSLIAVAFFMLGAGPFHWLGYKKGQIDYARDHVEYTIIAERVVHIMGKAPLPDTKLSPIEDGAK